MAGLMEGVNFKFPANEKSSKLVQGQMHPTPLQHEEYQPVQHISRENSRI